MTITGVDSIDCRRPGRAEDAVRRHARLDLQLRLRNPAGSAAERRPLLLPVAHRGPELRHRAGEQLVRQADHANTDVTHLSNTVFLTPTFTLEVNQANQYTGLGADGRADPTGG
jgi:hypothetical protein